MRNYNMRNYIIAYVSLFDNVMCMKKVHNESAVQALKDFLSEQYDYDFSFLSENPTVEEIEIECLNGDLIVGIEEI